MDDRYTTRWDTVDKVTTQAIPLKQNRSTISRMIHKESMVSYPADIELTQ